MVETKFLCEIYKYEHLFFNIGITKEIVPNKVSKHHTINLYAQQPIYFPASP